MTTLDDKLLGEKGHYYCSSSSEDEGDSDNEGSHSERESKNLEPKFIPASEANSWEGSSTNTGPKGVLKDWQKYKQLEAEKREEQEQERLMLIKKLSLTCASHKEEEAQQAEDMQLEEELRVLLDDEILEEFKRKRMQEMFAQATKGPEFGSVIALENGQDFLDAIDKEDQSTTVIIYIFREGDKDCALVHMCLDDLAKSYRQVKFCSIDVTSTGLSRCFKVSGVPALLIYKKGTLIGNFIRVTDELGDCFVSNDVENFLLEHGMLPDNSLIPGSIRQSVNTNID